MKTQKTSRFYSKSILYLFFFGITLSFSAFSCELCDEVDAPLEIQIENQTGYDLTDIRIDEVQITSLKNGETSNYISTKDFEYMKSVYAKVNSKFEKELSSFGTDSGLWCGTGLDTYPILHSGKHAFVIKIYQNEHDQTERLLFEKK